MLDLKLFGVLALMLGADSVAQTAALSGPPTVRSGGPAISCELAAIMPDAPVTADECAALMELFHTVAVVNPQASRDGDEQMTCSDIRTELSHMRRLGRQQSGRVDHSIVAVAQELSESMRVNPRLGRLVQLGAARHCRARERAT